jgi:hypothetical protein
MEEDMRHFAFLMFTTAMLLTACTSSPLKTDPEQGSTINTMNPKDYYEIANLSPAEAKSKFALDILPMVEMTAGGKSLSPYKDITIGEPVLVKSLSGVAVGGLESMRQEVNASFVSKVRASLSSEVSISSTGFVGIDKQGLESAISELNAGNYSDQVEAFSDTQTRSAVNRAYAGSGDFYLIPLYTKDGNYLMHYVLSSITVGGTISAVGMVEEAFTGSKDINLVLDKSLSKSGSQAQLTSLGGMSSGLYTLKDLHWLGKNNVGINILSGASYQLTETAIPTQKNAFNIIDQNVIIIDTPLRYAWKEVK